MVLPSISKTKLVLVFAALVSGGSALADDPKPVLVNKGGDAASGLVNTWFAEGKAAGLDGVYYDNRDRKHSDLRIATYPQLKPITYTEDELKRRADWGGQKQTFPGKVIVGNSSTASPATKAGSHQRMYYTHPRGPAFLYQQHRTNALYIYPEHRDHDPGTNGSDGFGDLYPANSPYLISSQGSSGSDRVFMHAFLKTIAAFPPETQKTLVANGLLMPTLQAIFRQTYKACSKPGDYFTGKAHPSAFDGKLIDELAMVTLAQTMSPDAIPPLVRLRVKDEPTAELGIDFFERTGFTGGEHLADTPCAIARIIRGPAHVRTIHVTASETADLKARPLRFRWALLRGDPDRVTITPVGKSGDEAKISVVYHPRRPISPGSAMWSNRVDIGVFAITEKNIPSAPAFISFTTLPNEHRTYADDGRLVEIFYGARSASLGMPPTDSDRWDTLLSEFDHPTEDQSPGFKIFTDHLSNAQHPPLTTLASATKEQRTQLAAASEKLDTITAAQQRVIDSANKVRVEAVAAHKKLATEKSKAALDTANQKHNAAKKSMHDGAGGAAELKTEIAQLRSNIVTAIKGAAAPEIVRTTLVAIRSETAFFSANESTIRTAAKDSPNPKANAAFTSALRNLESLGVAISDDPPSNERYHLELLNTAILSEVLLPKFLSRPPGFNYVDPRLTAPKHWRDVYTYSDGGNPTGWTRYQNGEQSEFDATGHLIRSRKPDGTPADVIAVRYAIDPKTKHLQHIPVD